MKRGLVRELQRWYRGSLFFRCTAWIATIGISSWVIVVAVVFSFYVLMFISLDRIYKVLHEYSVVYLLSVIIVDFSFSTISRDSIYV